MSRNLQVNLPFTIPEQRTLYDILRRQINCNYNSKTYVNRLHCLSPWHKHVEVVFK